MDKKDDDGVAVKLDRTVVFQEARIFNQSPMFVPVLQTIAKSSRSQQ
jgi:hypothetical protein